MENITLISSNPILYTTKQSFGLTLIPKKASGSLFFTKPRSKSIISAFSTPNSRRKVTQNNGKNVELFAASSRAQESVSVGVTPQTYVPPPSSQFGSPLFWIGVGVGFSALFSFAASWLKKYAMQQAFKTMMGQTGSQNNQFGNAAFPSGSPFGFPPPSASGASTFPGFPYQPPSTSGPSTSSATTGYAYSPPSTSGLASSRAAPSSTTPKSSPAASVTMDVAANKPEVIKPVVNDETETEIKAKQSAFVDVSPEETSQASPFENYNDTSSRSSEPAKFPEVVPNEAGPGTSSEWSEETRKKGSLLSVEMFETMMEDPNVQKMIYPNLPEEMRNPDTLKWMLQNPLYRQQLQDIIDKMGQGNLDSSLMENLKNYDLNSPEVKKQFDEIGVSPEEAISRLMSNPEVAMAFQNPKIQQAMMDLSQNPMNIMKYQNDKEVMDVFNKIQELFPGTSGY